LIAATPVRAPGTGTARRRLDHARRGARKEIIYHLSRGPLRLDRHGDFERTRSAAAARAHDRSCISGVEPAGEPHVAFRGTDAVGDVESDPAEALNPGLRPRLGRRLAAFTARPEVASHVA